MKQRWYKVVFETIERKTNPQNCYRMQHGQCSCVCSWYIRQLRIGKKNQGKIHAKK
jgi:hypothetical protein